MARYNTAPDSVPVMTVMALMMFSMTMLLSTRPTKESSAVTRLVGSSPTKRAFMSSEISDDRASGGKLIAGFGLGAPAVNASHAAHGHVDGDKHCLPPVVITGGRRFRGKPL